MKEAYIGHMAQSSCGGTYGDRERVPTRIRRWSRWSARGTHSQDGVAVAWRRYECRYAHMQTTTRDPAGYGNKDTSAYTSSILGDTISRHRMPDLIVYTSSFPSCAGPCYLRRRGRTTTCSYQHQRRGSGMQRRWQRQRQRASDRRGSGFLFLRSLLDVTGKRKVRVARGGLSFAGVERSFCEQHAQTYWKCPRAERMQVGRRAVRQGSGKTKPEQPQSERLRGNVSGRRTESQREPIVIFFIPSIPPISPLLLLARLHFAR